MINKEFESTWLIVYLLTGFRVTKRKIHSYKFITKVWFLWIFKIYENVEVGYKSHWSSDL